MRRLDWRRSRSLALLQDLLTYLGHLDQNLPPIFDRLLNSGYVGFHHARLSPQPEELCRSPKQILNMGPICRAETRSFVHALPAGQKDKERYEMIQAVVNLIAVVERSEHGYADVPPDSIDDVIESELAAFGYAVSLSDRLWVGGYRVHSPESIQFGNYRLYVPRSIFSCASSRFARVPDARDFDVESILEARGELPSN
jgi:hypothetical protein